MDIAPDTLRAVLATLTEAQTYVLHPASITPCNTKRVATHRVANHQFEALAGQLRRSAETLTAILRDVPS